MSASKARPAESLEDYTLLAILGERPQVMTELIWSLAQDGVVPKRIIVLTTARGEEMLRGQLLGDEEYRHVKQYDDRWTPFCNQVLDSDPLDLRVEVPEHTDETNGTKIEDIYDPGDVELFENWCFDLVHSLTREFDGPPLYGCIAGGRKTMAQDVTTAFSLYARSPDRLFHVVVSKHIEENVPEFFWPRADLDHDDFAEDVHRVEKRFPHLRARLEDGLLSEISGVNERSHYKELLNALRPDLQTLALTKPRQVTLRIQKKTSSHGNEMSGKSGSTLSVWDANGECVDEVHLKLKDLVTLLCLWNLLWKPGERKKIPPKLLQSTKTVDNYRKAVYGVFYDHEPSPYTGEYRPWYKEDAYYTEDGNDYRSEFPTSIYELNTEMEGVLKRYFLIQKAPPDDLSKGDSDEDYYAFRRTPPEDIKLRIEIVTDEREQLPTLATEEGWPFNGLPHPEVIDS